MYAIFQSSGKQFLASRGQIVRLEKLNTEKGKFIEFKNVMMITDGEKIQIGTPFLCSAKVIGEIINHGRLDKIRIIKFRRRKHYRKSQGHRQWFTDVKINNISI
ncbi:50S ribosomal protein L21 [Sodalis sp. CWE]|uniref:50S ribosomal protein L21 n=1 Tax=Sodalis sp. CWE TaxID=2803816 RepID=UPI001C7D01F1|nr:50S ribosomal protein L21 [Sodalis sp. CWE]MBX4180796.1 50S ribosomal protein L21 [Sodalis sp. CWE]